MIEPIDYHHQWLSSFNEHVKDFNAQLKSGGRVHERNSRKTKAASQRLKASSTPEPARIKDTAVR